MNVQFGLTDTPPDIYNVYPGVIVRPLYSHSLAEETNAKAFSSRVITILEAANKWHQLNKNGINLFIGNGLKVERDNLLFHQAYHFDYELFTHREFAWNDVTVLDVVTPTIKVEKPIQTPWNLVREAYENRQPYFVWSPKPFLAQQ